MKRLIAAAVVGLALTGGAEAKRAPAHCVDLFLGSLGGRAHTYCDRRPARSSKPFRHHRRVHTDRVDWHHVGERTGRAAGWPRAWCGAWMAAHKGLPDRRLWLARAWAHVGRAASGPAPGVIGVQAHHVYEVIQVVGPGRVLAISGNDGRAVRTRIRSTRGTFAWRVV